MGKKKKTGVLLLLVLLAQLLLPSVSFAEATELKRVISDVIFWDNANGREVIKNQGEYVLTENISYTIQAKFDLLKHNSSVKDGDYFIFEVPAPFQVQDTHRELFDETTGVAIGDWTVTSKGDQKGATVKVTLKNLQQYLEAKKASEITEVTGAFYVGFTAAKQDGTQTATFDNFIENPGKKDILYRVNERRETGDNSAGLGIENHAKYSGVLSRRPFQSDILGRSGEYVHPWVVRLNASRKNYTTYEVTDTIMENGGPMQFIPEKFVLKSGTGYNIHYVLQDAKTLTPGVDYTVTFDPSYTTFTLKINNPGNLTYLLTYETTAPADGTTVGNVVRVTGDGVAVPISDRNPAVANEVVRYSKVVAGANIQLDVSYRVVVYKVDETTREPLSGAVFTVTKQDGTVITLPPTDEKGRTYSEQFSSEEIAKGPLTLTEIQAPAGYELPQDNTRILNVTQDGAVRTIANKKIQTTSFTATKKWVGGPAEKPTVVLVLHRNGEAYSEQQLVNGQESVTWDQLPANDHNGTPYVYTVSEQPVANYTTNIEGSVVTNTYTSPQITVTATKKWVGGPEDRPTIQLQLLRNGQPYQEAVTLPSGTTEHSWQVAETDEAGNPYTYTVDEVAVPENYTKELDGLLVVNVYRAPATDVTGTVTWPGGSDTSSPIRLQLKGNGKNIGDPVVVTDGSKGYTWTDLPLTDELGNPIVYTVEQLDTPVQTAQGTPTNTSKAKGPQLPNTGTAPSDVFMWIGSVLLLVTGWLFWKQKSTN